MAGKEICIQTNVCYYSQAYSILLEKGEEEKRKRVGLNGVSRTGNQAQAAQNCGGE